ncbi:MAG: FtsL-like putative cell division protein [Bacteroidota bacterium]
MRKGFYDFLKGRFLVNEGAMDNWRFILFCTLLAILMIASSHSADKKVLEIAEMNEEIRQLRSEFVDTRKQLMQQKMESNIAKKMKSRGIGTSATPPQKIVVTKTED